MVPVLGQTVSLDESFEGGPSIPTWFGDACAMNTGFSNPVLDAVNNSSTVLEYHDTGGQYANVRFDVSENFDLSTASFFSLKIYVPSSGITGSSPNQVSLKLQDGTLGSPWVTQSEIIKPITLDQWQLVTFDFASDPYINLDPGSPPPITRTDFNRIVIQVNGENNFDHVLAYLDDISFNGTTPSTPVYDYLVWSDEFDGTGAIDASKWFHQTQLPLPDSWFNGEIQHYTDRIQNTEVSGGTLKLTARAESFFDQGVLKQHTSARLNSKFAFTYGRVEVRAKLPSGVGTWPAIWMLGKNINEDGAYWDNEGFGTTGWPDCGEIDIMEHWGSNQNYISSATHTPSSFGGTINVGGQIIPSASTDFHVYGLTWSPDKLVFDVDGFVHYTYEPEVYDATTWPFNADQYMLLNVAILPDIDPAFTSSAMEVDYVRVYQENPCSAPQNLQTLVSGPTTATISWDPVDEAIGYQVTGGPVGGATKTFKTPATSRTIPVLTASTSYEWQVRAYCDPQLSNWTALEGFTTPASRLTPTTFKLFPNPSQGSVRIMLEVSSETSESLELANLEGQLIRSVVLEPSQSSVELDGLESGVYMVRILGAQSVSASQMLIVY